MENRSKLLSIEIRNIGCIGNDGVTVDLDDIVCLVGRNNAGKSTVLNAYELAKGRKFRVDADRHQHASSDQLSEVVLRVHIPDGLGNVHSKWKTKEGEHLVVKSRWQWSGPNYDAKRQTWNPELENGKGDWDQVEKASGLDTVFGSRLPEPIRIGSLDDATGAQDQLLKLALIPLERELERASKDPSSPLSAAVKSIQGQVEAMASSHMEHFGSIAERVSTGFKGIFPDLGVSLDLKPAVPSIKFFDLVKNGSQISVLDGETKTGAALQGTGARRALFWAVLQVHNELERQNRSRNEHLSALEKERDALKKLIAKPKKGDVVDELAARLAAVSIEIDAHGEGAPLPEDKEDVAFPGYLLLIDEPENALHPMAARAAQKYLYELAKSQDWQVMLTTHSPYFVNPFEDHTTIVRLERSAGELGSLSTKTYRSDEIAFDADEKSRLQALQQMDPSFSEVFFGSYPVIVEGDTEHAAFLAAATEENAAIASQVTPIRARGKALIVPIIIVLRHFKIHFGVLHDLDSPKNKNGNGNGMWTENEKIWNEVRKTQKAGMLVRHRVSIPDFERLLHGDEAEKDKPLNVYLQVKASEDAKSTIRQLFQDLQHSDVHGPFGQVDDIATYMAHAQTELGKWVWEKGVQLDPRYAGLPQPGHVQVALPATPAPLI